MVYRVQMTIVAIATEEVEVHYDPGFFSHIQVLEVVSEFGFHTIVVSTWEDVCQIKLQVDGAHSEHSVKIVGNSVQALPGVQELNFDPGLKKLSISYKTDSAGPRDFIDVIESIDKGSFKAMIDPERDGREVHREKEIRK